MQKASAYRDAAPPSDESLDTLVSALESEGARRRLCANIKGSWRGCCSALHLWHDYLSLTHPNRPHFPALTSDLFAFCS